MKEISRDELIAKTGSIYKLCNVAALRAMELNSGMRKLVEAEPGEKVTTIAIREISEGKVRMKLVTG
ncbi:MAG: DNA-directed RNA polymerase subunit omega [Candidatus Omnitrophota bacterium]